jgi:hypothetical protein
MNRKDAKDAKNERIARLRWLTQLVNANALTCFVIPLISLAFFVPWRFQLPFLGLTARLSLRLIYCRVAGAGFYAFADLWETLYGDD